MKNLRQVSLQWIHFPGFCDEDRGDSVGEMVHLFLMIRGHFLSSNRHSHFKLSLNRVLCSFQIPKNSVCYLLPPFCSVLWYFMRNVLGGNDSPTKPGKTFFCLFHSHPRVKVLMSLSEPMEKSFNPAHCLSVITRASTQTDERESLGLKIARRCCVLLVLFFITLWTLVQG